MARKESKTTPAVIGGTLYTDDSATGARIDSPQWFAWCSTASTFYYDSPLGTFTAKYQQQRNTFYWFAYRRAAGKLHKVYIGKTDVLTGDVLRLAAIKLDTKCT